MTHLKSARPLRRALAAATAVSVIALGFSAFASPATADPSGPPTVTRISGSDRYSTAVALAQQGYPDGAPVLYVATGANYPDALAAGPAAAELGGPLLLTAPNSLPADVAAEVTALAPRKIYVVGGTSAVSAAVESSLKTLEPASTLTRLDGADRYDTARKVVASAFPSASSAYLATAENYPDALSAAAAAGATGVPVVLVDGNATSLDPKTTALLASLGTTDVTVAGGTAAVSAGLGASLTALLGTSHVTRLAGADRYVTSDLIAERAFPTSTKAYFATGSDYPDALAGSALAGEEHSPLLTVEPDCVPSGTVAEVSALGVASVTLIGGTNALTPAVEAMTSCDPTPAATRTGPGIATIASTRAFTNSSPALGYQNFGDEANATLSADSTLNHISFNIQASMSDAVYLAPPQGQLLHTGTWITSLSGVPAPSQPTLLVDIGGTEVGTDAGEPVDLSILDIAANPDGSIARLDVVFRTNYASNEDSEFGEIRFGEPQVLPLDFGYVDLAWPTTPKGGAPILATENIHNTGSVPEALGTASITGAAKASYSISSDGCSDTTLAADATCSLTVGFSPTSGGPQIADLLMPIPGSTQHVALAGSGLLGTSKITVTGTDFISADTTTTYAEGPYSEFATTFGGGTTFASLTTLPGDQPSIGAEFSVPDGIALTVGDHPVTGAATSAVMSISQLHRGCNQYRGDFDVHQIALAPDGSPTSANITFTQYCDGGATPATGTIQYQDRADVTAPDAVTDVTALGSGPTRTISWTGSTSSDARSAVARVIPGDGTNLTVTGGYATVPSQDSATAQNLIPGEAYTVGVFAIDATGNTSAPTLVHFIG